MSDIEKNICQAINIIVEKAIKQASYDKTIQAIVIECVDQTIGKYKVKYQDSIFYAYSSSTDVTYPNNSNVYILVPGNDMSNDKTILGTTKKLGINYIPTIEEEEAYEIIGNNCISSSEEFSLHSYEESEIITLYSKNSKDNKVNLNETSLEEYIKKAKTIMIAADIRTSLPKEQQYRGDYGIVFSLNFKDNSTGAEVTRYYTLDVDSISGNPYKLVNGGRQVSIFDIDGENFESINQIYIFSKNFPHIEEGHEPDIFIKDLELYGANRLNEEDISNYSLTFSTPQGTYFDSTIGGSRNKNIIAQVRVKGKVIDPNSQKLPYYWFVEHAGITNETFGYNEKGGKGWKCINQYNTLETNENGEPTLVEWIPSNNIFTVTKQDVVAEEVKYKCVVVYEGSIISRTITMRNLDSQYSISIESDSGTQFYYDSGYPTLTCKINGEEEPDRYTYYWAEITAGGNFNSLPLNIEDNKEKNEEYNNLIIDKEDTINNIQNNINPIANSNKLNNILYNLDLFKKIQRVEKNKIYSININRITNFSNFLCTVYDENEKYIGTKTISIYNSLNTSGTYSLVINNGSKVYKYDENGLSPASKALDSPIDIQALTFSVYDNLGNRIEDEALQYNNIEWIVPTTNTLLTTPTENEEIKYDAEGNKIYRNRLSLTYGIADRYNFNSINNAITLKVKYKDISLIAKTDFVFLKEGEYGSNGTDFTCRIVPNLPDAVLYEEYPTVMVVNGVSGYSFNFNPVSGQDFKLQLWQNEDLIPLGESSKIIWKMLQNNYGNDPKYEQDISFYEIDKGSLSSTLTYNNYTSYTADIIKGTVTYNGINYYATLPLITTRVSNAKYKVKLKYGSGFRYVMYSSDGRIPKWTNLNPFELLVFEKRINEDGNEYEENISLNSDIKLQYTWNIIGLRLKDGTERYYLKKSNIEGLSDNQYSVRPVDEYDGMSVTNALECVISLGNGIEIARIHIPIHFYLNRYGNGFINDWDGNSVEVNEDGGFILAPQIGAGEKDNNNAFTGVVMGKVLESNRTIPDIGLLGYSHGERSIFLDAETGKSVFGINNGNQIILDPTDGTATIRSGNYNTKKPTQDEEPPQGGMEIDFSTPQINFGTGNFNINAQGHITAKGGGTIAGWSIDDYKIYNEKTGLNHVIDKNETGATIYTFNDITSLEKDDEGKFTEKTTASLAFWAGEKKDFFVTHDGYLSVNKATIGSGSDKIYIAKSSPQSDQDDKVYSAIMCKKKTLTDSSSGFYLGTNGISLGRTDEFIIKSDGGGKIAGWSIDNKKIFSNEEKNNKVVSRIVIRSDGTIAGGNVDENGVLTGNKGWYIKRNGDASFNSGTIGGWNISSDKISAGDIQFNAEGSLKHTGNLWYINADGSASFSKVTITGTKNASGGYSSNIGGWCIDANGLRAPDGGDNAIYINSSDQGEIGGNNGGTNIGWYLRGNGEVRFNKVIFWEAKNITIGTQTLEQYIKSVVNSMGS